MISDVRTIDPLVDIGRGCGDISSDDLNECLRGNLHGYISDVRDDSFFVVSGSTKFPDGDMFFENERSESISKIRYIPSEAQLTNPSITLDVQAKWIGVRSLVSKPTITNIDCGEAFQQNGVIEVSVINDGAVSSRFGVKLDSCGTFDQISEVGTKTIPSKLSANFLIPIDSEGKTTTETCSVTAFNTELSQTLKDTKSVICKSVEIQRCGEGDQILTKIGDRDCVKECVGGQYPEIPSFCCEKGVTFSVVLGKQVYTCLGNKTEPFPDCDSCDAFVRSKIFGWVSDDFKCIAKEAQLIPPKPGQGNLVCIFSWIKLSLVPIVFLFALLFGANLFAGLKVIKNKKWVAWVVAGILAIILSILTYYLFWTGVVIFGIFLLVRFILKLTIGK